MENTVFTNMILIVGLTVVGYSCHMFYRDRILHFVIWLLYFKWCKNAL